MDLVCLLNNICITKRLAAKIMKDFGLFTIRVKSDSFIVVNLKKLKLQSDIESNILDVQQCVNLMKTNNSQTFILSLKFEVNNF